MLVIVTVSRLANDRRFGVQASTSLESRAGVPVGNTGPRSPARFRDQPRSSRFSLEIACPDGCKRAVEIPACGCATARTAVQRISPLIGRLTLRNKRASDAGILLFTFVLDLRRDAIRQWMDSG